MALRNAGETPYQLDPDQALRASTALLTHMKVESKKLLATSSKKSLLAATDSDDEENSNEDVSPVWLNLATKRHIVDKNRLKPSKIKVPHTLNASEDISICLITTDPQRAVKNAIADPTFPATLSSKITKVIGLSKLEARYKSFESKRQLLTEHDVFLADDRIILRLPALLGKIFYKGTAKRPIPISISPRKTTEEKSSSKKPKKREEKEAAVASPSIVAAEIERALSCVPVSLKPGLNVSIRIGLENFTPEQLTANVAAVVPKLIENHVAKGWRNVRSINIKSPTSFAVPIWQSDDLWAEDENLLTAEHATGEDHDDGPNGSSKRKRNTATVKGPQTGQRKRAKTENGKAPKDHRKERLAAQKSKLFNTET